MYQVLARKFRPQKFSDVVDQNAIVATLKNAFRMEKTAHAYLFCGCRGTGKTTLARLFAKVLNCLSPTAEMEPCNLCPSCRNIAAGHSMDVLEIDGASHRGIEDIRQINETVGFTPSGGRFKIYLIDEVHMLTKEAFNALLKTLEEPPSHVKFFFCTTEPHKIPATIISRCQKFNLNRISIEKMVAKLEEVSKESGIAIEKEALIAIAERGSGSLRDALSLLDQVAAFDKGTITYRSLADLFGLPPKKLLAELDQAGLEGDFLAAFRIADDVFSSGVSIPYFLEELISHFRSLLLAPPHKGYRTEQLIQILELLLETQQSIKSAPSERCALEMVLLKILRSHQQMSLETLVTRLLALEGRLSTTENPIPKPEELPSQKTIIKGPAAEVQQSAKSPPKGADRGVANVQTQSRFDTIMRFAAIELNGSLKKE